MDQMALSYLLLVVAAIAYLTAGIGVVRILQVKGAVAPDWMRNVAFAGFAVHVAGVFVEMFASDVIHFGFGMAVSAMLLIAVLITLIESCVHRVTVLTGLVLIMAAAGSVLPVIFPGEIYRSETWSMLFRVHLLVALSAYSFMSIAVIQAVLLMRMDKQLKSPMADTDKGILANMPNLLAMERILFRIVACGFVCLTLVLVLGGFATMQAHGVPYVLDHKTVMTWLAWVVFAILLVGRYGFGWRKKKALTWFWAGIVVLAVAYLVYRFLIETFLM
ncbi:MAG: cytochrome c biogenesis protein CcsA [Sutterellaceae bacterium]|nr:cytochrome c biogenesis protein CcsA [Sutterellaceae bacterium]